ncbi:hypothetical protein DICPUDRAFT_154314 [Dictyostelium purpureum]|uniref:Carbohydrate binding domain-containing protein n=1 Tax=Dictyostelium purpureum TaxID=5786 RepID=F0ZR08_DICPU|nr:uncharacterized protein DICPUDRAFT_154314 [Dictyostelium purpureum]EGC33635.1 hypothetical protein DICPUDRAFT_154314 [Dictyostelium purpureum]|eukprot:XP_003289855.1 hypothetical protein DICPUDRAFT_154314 [Dictyostelium purpureum]
MKLLLFLILILCINYSFGYDAKLYILNEKSQEWDIVKIPNLALGTGNFEETHPPNFLFKQIVEPSSTVQLKFILENDIIPKRDVMMDVNGGIGTYFFRDKFGELYPKDNFLHNNVWASYCGKDNFGPPYYFNYTCLNRVMSCSISARINYGYFNHCK